VSRTKLHQNREQGRERQQVGSTVAQRRRRHALAQHAGGGVLFNCSSGGKAKPMSMANTVTSAMGSGASDAAGSSVRMRSRNSHARPTCAR